VKTFRLLIISFVFTLGTGACGRQSPPPLTPSATFAHEPSPTPLLSAFPPITPTHVTRPTASSPSPVPTASPVATPASEWRPHYDLTVELDAMTHSADVTAQVTLRPPDQTELVFNVNALQAESVFQLKALLVNGVPTTPRVENVWLYVPLAALSSPKGMLTITFTYTLALPPIEPMAWGWRGSLGWTSRQINLGDWYPTLAVYQPGIGWITHLPSPLGEYQTTHTSDFHVRFHIVDFPSELVILGSGQAAPCEGAQCFTLSGGRFVAYVISDQMRSQSVRTSSGILVTSAYFAEDAVAGKSALQTAAAAVEIYSQRYGAYPYSSLVIVEGDFYDGMEYSSMCFVGQSYYQAFDQTPQNLLTAITAHEVAHQWWYSQVGNDQAVEPWLDEALSTYSELIYLEAAHLEAVPWWWAWRVETHRPAGRVNGRIYDFTGFRPYVNGVYLRGAQMLHAMRQALGDERFFAFLGQYAEMKTNDIATAADFWQAYQAAGGDPAAIQARFFDEP